MIGTPLTVGFISKWYLILAALERDWWWLAVLILLGSLLAVVYIWKVVEVLYFQSSDVDSQTIKIKEAPLSMLIPVWVIILANIYFGVNASLTTGIARQTAVYLLGGS